MKTIALVAMQTILAASIVAMGCALIGGPDPMTQRFTAIGLGEGGRMAAGVVQIIAGLCLMVPRGQVVGAALLAFLTVGILGMAIGHLAADADLKNPLATRAPQFAAVVGACEHGQAMIFIIPTRRELNI